MANSKGKVQVKVEAKKKAVKAKTSSNSGGIFTAKVAAIVNKRKSK